MPNSIDGVLLLQEFEVGRRARALRGMAHAAFDFGVLRPRKRTIARRRPVAAGPVVRARLICRLFAAHQRGGRPGTERGWKREDISASNRSILSPFLP